MSFLEKIRARAMVIINKPLEKIAPEKRRLVVMSAVGVCAALLLVLIIIHSSRIKAEERASAANASQQQRAGTTALIPHEDIFLPHEPDFVPDVILNREQRTAWTAEDAAPWWQDPLKDGEEPWRSRIEKIAEEILESVP